MADEEAKKPAKEEKAEKPDTKGKKDKKDKKGKKDGEGDEDDDRKGGGFVVALVTILVVIIWLAIFALLIKTDVGGFGSTVMYPILKNVPYLNKILPEVEEYAQEDSAYQFATMDEAVARIKELEGQLKAAQDQSATDAATLADLQAQAAELQTYKENEAKFEQEKQQFYEDIVYSDNAPDTSAYRQYYEEIEPDNAEAIYRQVVQQDEADSKIQDYAKTYSSMKASQAASIFNTMTDNLDLVAKILNAMSASQRGAILGAMNADTAAKITEIMNPN